MGSKEAKENKHKSKDFTTTEAANFLPNWKKQIEDDLNSKKYLDQHVDDITESENDEMETESESDLCKNDIKDMNVISKEAKENKHKSKDFTTTETAIFFPNWKKQIEDDLNSKVYLEPESENHDLETESESDL